MRAEHIASTIKALRTESAKIQAQDKQVAQAIDELISELEADINPEPAQSVLDKTSAMIESTEARHPQITLILNDLMVKLASIGV